MKLSIVSYLDPQSSQKVRKIQQELSDVTGSKGSLESWEPHVTIGDGVEVNEAQLDKLKIAADLIAKENTAFKFNLRGIGSLDNWHGGADETPYVIYLDGIANDYLLDLISAIDTASANYDKWYLMPRPYLPHCTLAFRDLSKAGYKKGLAYLEKMNPEIHAKIDHIALVEKLPNVDRELIRFELGVSQS